MQDEPRPTEIIAAVARYLRGVIAPATSGHVSFNARVCANALEMSLRQLEGDETAERERLKGLLGHDGELADLNAELAHRIAAREIDLSTPGLVEHLWAATLAKLAVDQPTYWGYRAALEKRTSQPPPPLRGPAPPKGEENIGASPPSGGAPAKPGRG